MTLLQGPSPLEMFVHSMANAIACARSGDRATARDFVALARLHATGRTGREALSGVEYERAERIAAGLETALDPWNNRGRLCLS